MRAFLERALSGDAFVLLEDRLTPGASGLLYSDPVALIECATADQIEICLERIAVAGRQGLHVAGFFGFELGYWLESHLRPLLMRRLGAEPLAGAAEPLLRVGLFPAPTPVAAADLDRFFAARAAPPPVTALAATIGRPEHRRQVEAILAHIRAGDVYQINLTFPLTFHYAGDPLALYAALRVAQPSAHGGLVGLGDMSILSVSPELFVDVTDGRATARPMKGTVARGPDGALDAGRRDALAADPKQRAENLMIVDLLRNDLARISEPRSVAVERLFTVETYPTLHTMTSTVQSRLRPEIGIAEVLPALFPCGSVVGAPKIRALELIAQIERCPRGAYTGSIGFLAPPAAGAGLGRINLNVAIRTAILRPDGANSWRGSYGTGGGIVADSEPDTEYDEALLKARILTGLSTDYGLIETLCWSPSEGFVRLDRHLARLASSAAALGFALSLEALEAALTETASILRSPARIRVELRRDGEVEITSAVLTAEARSPLAVSVAAQRIDAADPFLRHKTTRRTIYEEAFAAAAALGHDEALLLNRWDRIVEASRNNAFVEMGGRLVTPPLDEGCLPGILRQELLATGRAVERTLTLADLAAAPAWYLGNSLRGLRRARLV